MNGEAFWEHILKAILILMVGRRKPWKEKEWVQRDVMIENALKTLVYISLLGCFSIKLYDDNILQVFNRADRLQS